MAEVATPKPEIFTRKASGLVRVMSPYSAFVYNILTMGLIFPWTYLWAPGALPGGRLVWGILLAMIFEIPIAFVYVWLSTALPRSGGDYVFQSRVFGGGAAFTVVIAVVISTSFNEVERIAQADTNVFSTFYQRVKAGLQIPSGGKWDVLRGVAEHALFPGYKDHIRFGAFSLDGDGVWNYGECAVTLKDRMVTHRTTLFEELTEVKPMRPAHRLEVHLAQEGRRVARLAHGVRP